MKAASSGFGSGNRDVLTVLPAVMSGAAGGGTVSDRKSKSKDRPRPKKQPDVGNELPCERALEQGNYLAARKLARQALSGDDAAVAREVLARVAVDKVPLLVFLGCLTFFLVVAWAGLR